MNEVWVVPRADGREEYVCQCGEHFGAAKWSAKRHMQDGCDRPKAEWIKEAEGEPVDEVAALREDLERAIEAARGEGLEEGVVQGLILAFETVERLEPTPAVIDALQMIADAIDDQKRVLAELAP